MSPADCCWISQYQHGSCRRHIAIGLWNRCRIYSRLALWRCGHCVRGIDSELFNCVETSACLRPIGCCGRVRDSSDCWSRSFIGRNVDMVFVVREFRGTIYCDRQALRRDERTRRRQRVNSFNVDGLQPRLPAYGFGGQFGCNVGGLLHVGVRDKRNIGFNVAFV